METYKCTNIKEWLYVDVKGAKEPKKLTKTKHKKTWIEVLRKDILRKVIGDMTQDKIEWLKKPHVASPNLLELRLNWIELNLRMDKLIEIIFTVRLMQLIEKFRCVRTPWKTCALANYCRPSSWYIWLHFRFMKTPTVKVLDIKSN